MSESREFVFALTDEEATALIRLGVALEHFTDRESSLDRATARLDEQMTSQMRSWERCPTCDGSGWVEDAA